MAAIPAFRFIHVRRPMMKHLLVRWAVAPTNYPMEDIRFVVFRSTGPDSNWDEIGVAEPGAFHYYDYNIDAGDSRIYYYIVRAASVSGKGFVDSQAVYLAHDPDPIAMELVRKKELFLENKAGISVAVLAHKQYGAKCSRCWDTTRNMASDPDCPDCFGVGFSGGFLQPIFTRALVNPPSDSRQGNYEVQGTTMELSVTPFLSIGDIIVDRTLNTRYQVTDVKFTTHRMAYVSQLPTVNKLDENSVIYTIPVPEPDFATEGKSWAGDR